jgi:hypothetical protein
MATKSAKSEHTEQSQFFGILRRLDHPAAQWAFAIPNGFLDTKSKRIRAWQEGMLSGVPDIFVPYPVRGFHGLFLEFKAQGGRVTKAQEDFLNYAHSVGYKAALVFGLREALEVFKEYIEGSEGLPDTPEGSRDSGEGSEP